MKDRTSLPPALERELEALLPALDEMDVPADALGVILGSGLGGAADGFPVIWSRSFDELGLTAASVAGHSGRLTLAEGPGAPFLFLQGRIHRYEGHPDAKVLLPAALMASLGPRALLITNAAGGMDSAFRAGDFMLIRDILSFQLDDPLRGLSAGTAQGRGQTPRRPLFDAELSAGLLAAAAEAGVTMHEGVMNAATGPTYETRAEISMSRMLGAKSASMSTFPECMLLAHMGQRLVAMSCITNEIRSDDTESGEPLTHDEVVEVGLSASKDFGRLLSAWSRRRGV